MCPGLNTASYTVDIQDKDRLGTNSFLKLLIIPHGVLCFKTSHLSKKLYFAAFTDFHSVNTFIMTSLKLIT